jgi:ABC-type transport system substrate-binding protein
MTPAGVRPRHASTRLVGVLSAGALLLAACAATGRDASTGAATGEPPAGPPGGTLSVIVPAPLPVGLDPSATDPRVLRAVGPMVTATLLRPALDGGPPRPWLAESATSSSDARSWTIVLRPDAAFASGAPLTAADVAFGLTEGAADPQRASRFGSDGDGSWFVSAVARDPRTVVVTFRQPHAAFDRMVLAAPEFGCVRSGYAGADRTTYYRDPDSCGPYRFERTGSAAPAGLRLARNPRYPFAADVRADALVVTTSPPSGAAVVLDAVAGDTAVERFALSTPAVLSLLVLRNEPPTSDRNLRQAVLALVDGAAMAAVDAGSIPATSGMTPPGWAGAASIGAPTLRPRAAEAALGLVDQDSRSLRLLVPSEDAVARRRADLLVAEGARRGLAIAVEASSQRRYERLLASGGFQAAIRSVDVDVAHAAEISRSWSSTDAFGGGWPPSAAATAYAGQLGPDAAAVEASAGFERSRIDGAWAVPLAIDVRRTGVVGAVLGVRVGVDGSMPLELFAVAPPTSDG